MAYGNYTGKIIDVSRFSRKWLDVPYAHTSPAQTLDLYLPETGDGPFPLIVLTHGGGWYSGSKRGVTMECLFRCLDQGFALASVEYRFATDEPVPAQVHDCKAAIRFLRAHAAEYQIDPKRFAVWGNSSGGYLANMIGATGAHPGLVDDPELAGDAAGESCAVQAVVSWYTASDLYQMDLCDALTSEENLSCPEPGSEADAKASGLPTMQAIALGFEPRTNYEAAMAASPITYVDSSFPPAIFQHGTADVYVPFTQSVAIWKRVVDECGADHATLELFEGSPHGAPAIKLPENVDRCLNFVREAFSQVE